MRSARWGVPAGAAALLACTVAVGPTASGSVARPVGGGADGVVLGNGDTGRAVTVHPGDSVTVRLSGMRQSGSTWAWSVPQSADAGVLARASGGTTPTGDASATFHAGTAGRTTIDAYQRCVPDPGTMCTLSILHWTATVTVR